MSNKCNCCIWKYKLKTTEIPKDLQCIRLSYRSETTQDPKCHNRMLYDTSVKCFSKHKVYKAIEVVKNGSNIFKTVFIWEKKCFWYGVFIAISVKAQEIKSNAAPHCLFNTIQQRDWKVEVFLFWRRATNNIKLISNVHTCVP